MLEMEKAKLFLHKIPYNVPSEELDQVLSGKFTLDVKVEKSKPCTFFSNAPNIKPFSDLGYFSFGSKQKHRDVTIVHLLFLVVQKTQIKHLKTLMEFK